MQQYRLSKLLAKRTTLPESMVLNVPDETAKLGASLARDDGRLWVQRILQKFDFSENQILEYMIKLRP